jgi:transcription initiation factor IIE alpha subunit
MLKKEPTPTQALLIRMINVYKERHNEDPTVEQLAQLMSIPVPNIYTMLQRLRKNEFIGMDTCVKRKNQHLRKKWIKEIKKAKTKKI